MPRAARVAIAGLLRLILLAPGKSPMVEPRRIELLTS
jgi:hypothetical protein